MTTTTRNEAAERLRMKVTSGDNVSLAGMCDDLDESLAAERRATVERIRGHLFNADMALLHNREDRAGLVSLSDIERILDEEAVRV